MSFFREHFWPGIGLLLGPAIFIGGLVLHALALIEIHPSIEIWEIIGAAIFFLSVIGILVKQNKAPQYSGSPQIETTLSGLASSISSAPSLPTAAERILVPLDVFLETSDDPKITYKRKLRIVLRNDSGENITVKAPPVGSGDRNRLISPHCRPRR